MELKNFAELLKSNTYPGRGIMIGKTKDGTHGVISYFIMGRSENSRNRVFVEDGLGIKTKAFDESKLTDPSLIIYAPVRVIGNTTIVTNGDQTVTKRIPFMMHWSKDVPLKMRCVPVPLNLTRRTLPLVFREKW